MSKLFDALTWFATTQPGITAIKGDQTSLRYGDLPRLIDSLAETFAEYVERGRPVALMCDNSPAWVLADLALLSLDAVHVPLPPFFTDAQVEHTLESTGATLLLSDLPLDGRDLVAQLTVAGDPLFLYALKYDARPLHEGTAKITFTSGTTGTPKGVCLSQASMEATAEAVLERVGASMVGRHVAVLPLGVLLENVAGLYACLIGGGTYVVLSQKSVGFGEAFKPDFMKLVAVLASQQASSTIMVPELLRGTLAVISQVGNTLDAMRMIAVGGSRISVQLLNQALSLGLPVCEGYGLSEAGSVVAMNAPGNNTVGTVGLPLKHVSLAQLDSGELILTDAPFLGYVGCPPHEGPYRTGDITSFDTTGRLMITGRVKNVLINSFGRNIAPEWVESELLAQPEIAQALVYGDDRPALGAVLVPTSPAIGGDALMAAVARANAALPDYSRVKHWFTSSPFTMESGELTGTGRPRRTTILKEKEAMIEQSYKAEGATQSFFDRLVRETEAERQAMLSLPIIQAGLKGEISRDVYIAYLTEAYHHVKHTVPLMQATKAHTPTDRTVIHDALDEYIDEEKGHEEWILNDIRHAGGDADAARASDPAFGTEMMVAYAYDYVTRINPIGFFGMVFVLEGTSTALATQAAEKLMTSLGLSKNCFSYLLSHGALDLEHMEFFKGLMTKITDPADQDAIIHMAKRMYRLFGAMFESVTQTEELKNVA